MIRRSSSLPGGRDRPPGNRGGPDLERADGWPVRDFGRGISPAARRRPAQPADRPGADRGALPPASKSVAGSSGGTENQDAPVAALSARSPAQGGGARGDAGGPRRDPDQGRRRRAARPGCEPGADRARRPPGDHDRPDLRRDAARRRDLGGGPARLCRRPGEAQHLRPARGGRAEDRHDGVGGPAAGLRLQPLADPTSAARWKRSPTRCAPRPTATASTSSSASPRPAS